MGGAEKQIHPTHHISSENLKQTKKRTKADGLSDVSDRDKSGCEKKNEHPLGQMIDSIRIGVAGLRKHSIIVRTQIRRQDDSIGRMDSLDNLNISSEIINFPDDSKVPSGNMNCLKEDTSNIPCGSTDLVMNSSPPSQLPDNDDTPSKCANWPKVSSTPSECTNIPKENITLPKHNNSASQLLQHSEVQSQLQQTSNIPSQAPDNNNFLDLSNMLLEDSNLQSQLRENHNIPRQSPDNNNFLDHGNMLLEDSIIQSQLQENSNIASQSPDNNNVSSSSMNWQKGSKSSVEIMNLPEHCSSPSLLQQSGSTEHQLLQNSNTSCRATGNSSTPSGSINEPNDRNTQSQLVENRMTLTENTKLLEHINSPIQLLEKNSIQSLLQERNNTPNTLIGTSAVTDQLFLLSFIIGNYLGPDVISDAPRRSASQRMAEGLRPYTSTDLGSSFVSLHEIESLYYFMLRDAHRNAVLKSSSLRRCLNDSLPAGHSVSLDNERKQFTAFFPTDLHKQARKRGSRFKIFKGIVIIEDPDVSFVKQDELERFRLLTGLNEIKINKVDFEAYCRMKEDEKRQQKNKSSESKRRRLTDPLVAEQIMPITIAGPSSTLYPEAKEETDSEATIDEMVNDYSDGSSVEIVMPSSNPRVQWLREASTIILPGTAEQGNAGPSIGFVDIGISTDAYLFRVSLPGIKRNQNAFTCEVATDGMVHLKGTTVSGGNFDTAHQREFLGSTGNLEISFTLPGLVDPRLFSGNFRDDGIFDAVVMKLARTSTPSEEHDSAPQKSSYQL